MTFMFPTELAVVKSKLESEGIECKVLDENTVQVHNFLSQAIGGVRLQVAESNLERARKILEESGLTEKEKEPEQSEIERTINNPKFQKRMKFLLVTLVSITVVLALTLFVYRYLNRPTDLELLTESNWCVDYIVYQNQEYVPYTLSDKIQIRFVGECSEKLNFETTVAPRSGSRNIENRAYAVTKKSTQLYVNLRCMQIKDHQAIVYVGGGITESSDAESEWQETVSKSLVIKNVL